MVEITWVPTKAIPCGYIVQAPTEKQYIDTWLPGYRSQRGMIYSSVRIHEKYVGYNVSLETYMTALSNPNSVLYTRPQHGLGRAMYSYYGNVCSVFVSYACDLPYRTPCAAWPTMEGVTEVDTSRLENLRLCDIVLNVETHIAIITAIERDIHGKVHRIEVSESTPPKCLAKTYTPEEFRKFWLEDNFRIYRYEGIHNATYTPSPYVHLEGDPWLEVPPVNTAFMTDFGNKANYLMEEAVEFSVFEDEWETIEVSAPDGEVTALPIVDAKAVFRSSVSGYHTAVCRKGARVSLPLEFFVVDVHVTTDQASYAPGETIRIRFQNTIPEDEIFTMLVNTDNDFVRRRRSFTAQEMEAGCVEIPNDLAPGKYHVKVMARNGYGIYASQKCHFSVTE